MLMEFLKEEKAQNEWSAAYILLILAIVALLIIFIVKPMFRDAQKVVSRTESGLRD